MDSKSHVWSHRGVTVDERDVKEFVRQVIKYLENRVRVL